MIVLSANQLSKAYGVHDIFSDITFNVNKGERIGLVGTNGAGKTTLLNILSGNIPYDNGSYFVSEHCQIGYLRQSSSFSSNKTVYEEMLSIFSHLIQMEKDMSAMSLEISSQSEKGLDVHVLLHRYDDLTEEYKKKSGYSYKSEIQGILNSMGFDRSYFDKPVSILSGGEKTRLALAGLLLKKPDLLLMDEPTNHLDTNTLRWLEQYLKSYDGSIIVISHDRYFLDQTVNRVFEIENGQLASYAGNYTEYTKKKKMATENAQRQYEAQQKEIARQEEIIRRFKQHGTEKLAKRARSRENALAHIRPADRPALSQGKFKIHFKQGVQSGNDVLHVENLSKSFEARQLFQNVSFDIKKKEKVALVGSNGIGKTTLLKMILSALPSDSGMIKPGFHVTFGYYDQGQELLNPDNTILNEVHSDYRLYDERELRSILGRFLFKGDDVFKPVAGLSGGEKARLSLLKLMLSGTNFLIMDEPTNHLDIQSKEIFEDALLDFPGTALFVSHDRYFLNKVPTRILELDQNGIYEYLGNYDFYQEKKGETKVSFGLKGGEGANNQGDADNTDDAITSKKEQYVKNKEAEKILRSKRKALAAAEEKIAQHEENIKAIEEEMCREDVFSDYERMNLLHDNLTLAKDSLDQTYVIWAKLSEELESAK